jgi:hypothetical protein
MAHPHTDSPLQSQEQRPPAAVLGQLSDTLQIRLSNVPQLYFSRRFDPFAEIILLIFFVHFLCSPKIFFAAQRK